MTGGAQDGRTRAEAYAALGALALVWGYTWVVIKIATHDASPYVVAALRTGGGALVLLAALPALRRPLAPTPFAPTLILGLLQTTGFTLLQTIAVSLAGAGKVAVLAYTMPFWVALIAWPLLGEPITAARRIALALAAIGLAFVLAPLGPATIVPDVLAVLSGIVWAASAVWTKRLQARAPVDLLRLTAWQMVCGALPLVVLALALPHAVRLTPGFAAAIAFVVVFSQALAWILWMFVLGRLPASVAGIASLATPVIGVIASALQLHEIPSATEVAGIVLIVAALVVNARPASNPRRTPRSAAVSKGA